jgi:hypothetical protein
VGADLRAPGVVLSGVGAAGCWSAWREGLQAADRGGYLGGPGLDRDDANRKCACATKIPPASHNHTYRTAPHRAKRPTAAISPNIYISPRADAIAVSSTDQPVRGGPQRYPLPVESCGTRRACSRRGHGDAAVPVDDPGAGVERRDVFRALRMLPRRASDCGGVGLGQAFHDARATPIRD